MALEDVIARLSNRGNRCEKPAVTVQAAKTLAITAVTAVTALSEEAEAKTGKPGSIEPLPATREWLEAQGCRSVLPLDAAHIKKHLPVGTAARNRVLLAYVDTWLQAAEAEQKPHRRDNAGRRAANIGIREGTL